MMQLTFFSLEYLEQRNCFCNAFFIIASFSFLCCCVKGYQSFKPNAVEVSNGF